MHLVQDRQSKPIESESQLVSYFSDASKPRDAWRVGIERELIGVYKDPEAAGVAPPYPGPRGIRAVLERFGERGWAPVTEGENIIAMVRGDAQVTIEPGGQLELAARPVSRTADFEADLEAYGEELAAVSQGMDVAWLGVGFRPFGRLDDVPWMPKQRYEVMRAYMPTRGALAHEMMKRTATTQVNLDYDDVEDATLKLRAAMGVDPLLTALYANSPIVDGQIVNHQSYRARIWRDTDPDRCGVLRFAFEDDDVFTAYTQWALDVPLFFVYRHGYLPAGGMTFRRFMREGFQGERATMDDWGLHLSTLFPQVRLKKYLEIRGCDSGARDMVLALGPLCRGFLYDRDACEATIALTAGLSFEDRVALWVSVSEKGLRAPVPGTRHTAQDLARELVDIAAAGLARQAPAELPYLEPVREIAETGRTQADALLDLWRRTGGDPARVIAALELAR
ncbi:MAG TPA: glutamate-cysteine ligase family protein [Haliangium sp.]|nr:glutamate-cysteine ligase family protein [Haliangium sp.]